LLDTSNLDIEAALDTAVGAILRKVGQGGRAWGARPQSSWHKVLRRPNSHIMGTRPAAALHGQSGIRDAEGPARNAW